MTQIIFNTQTKEVVAIIGDDETIIDNDYTMLSCSNAEPTYQMENGKLIVDLTTIIINDTLEEREEEE